MSKEADQIRESLIGMVAPPSPAFIAVVKEVDEATFGCTVRRDDAVDYFDVRLRSTVMEETHGFSFIPAVDSVVIVSRIDGSNELFVSLFGQIDKVIFSHEKIKATIDLENIDVEVDGSTLHADKDNLNLSVAGTTIDVDHQGVVINGGDNGGVIKIAELTQKVNALIKAFNDHEHIILSGSIATTGGPSAQSNAAPVTCPKIVAPHAELNKSDYENEKVKH